MVRLIASIDVDDLDQAVAFYTRALGLRERRRLFGDSAAELVGASSAVYLLAVPAGSRPVRGHSFERDYGRHWTPVHLDFVVSDVDTAVERAVAAGAVLEGDIRDYDGWREATLSDPFGHGFCLLEGWPA
jgi:catechol 2,3-dioxygenase-like lactoylglutathione lyase family enzyme